VPCFYPSAPLPCFGYGCCSTTQIAAVRRTRKSGTGPGLLRVQWQTKRRAVLHPGVLRVDARGLRYSGAAACLELYATDWEPFSARISLGYFVSTKTGQGAPYGLAMGCYSGTAPRTTRPVTYGGLWLKSEFTAYGIRCVFDCA